jgi:glycerophosphoryl diester phosphodiesterase
MNPAPSQNLSATQATKSTAIVAHRGGSLLAPENTLSAFRNALNMGVDRIELDVQQTKDFVTVVMHDHTINRTTNGKGRVGALTYEKLKTMDAGIKFSKEFGGEQVPTLEEVLTLVDGKCTVMIEIKNPDNIYTDLEKDVVGLIRKHNAYAWCVVQSFNYQSVLKVHELDAKINTGWLLVKINHDIKNNNHQKIDFLTEINIYHRFAGKKTVDLIHSLHKKVFAWTANHPERIKKLIQNGVDGIMTDNPELMKALLNR